MTEHLNKISQAIAKSGLTITDISKKLSLSRNSFYQKLRGQHKFTIDEIKILAKITEKPISFFIEENEFEIKNFSTEQIPVNKIPLISWVSANHFGEASDPFPPGIADEWVYSTTKGGKMFALTIKKDCMEPHFFEGEIIIINPSVQPSNGDYVVIKDTHNNEATFKQYKVYGKKIVLHPLNPKYQDIEIDHENRYEIIGKVVEKVRKY